MKYCLAIVMAGLLSCSERKDAGIPASANEDVTTDTVIKKQESSLENRTDSGFYAKKIWYY